MTQRILAGGKPKWQQDEHFMMTPTEPTIRVKLVTRSGEGAHFLWAKQCPGSRPTWGSCEFISLPSFRDYDWYVAVDDVPRVQPGHREHLACPRDNTILITSEPSSVTRYGKAFAAQFGKVITNQEARALPHPHAIRSQTGNIWFYEKSFDELVQTAPMPKTELISTVCSSKQQAHTMHARRYAFTQKLKKDLTDLEIFGHGVRFIEKKLEALDPFKFHLVSENHIAPHVWTEKLADAFLAYSVPIYCGCTNVTDYFPAESIVQVNIDDYEGSLAAIRQVLTTEGEYERRLEAVKEARRRVMYEYNLPAMLNRIISEAGPSKSRVGEAIYSRKVMRARNPGDFARFIFWQTGNFRHKIVSYLRRFL
jgi:hypothetical protein